MTKIKKDIGHKPPLYMSDGLYEFLRFFCMIVSPTGAAAYLLASKIFDLSDVVLYLVVAYLFFSALVGGFLIAAPKVRAKIPWGQDGSIVVTETPEGRTIYSLELDDDPESLQDKRIVSFSIVKNDRKSNNAYNGD